MSKKLPDLFLIALKFLMKITFRFGKELVLNWYSLVYFVRNNHCCNKISYDTKTCRAK